LLAVSSSIVGNQDTDVLLGSKKHCSMGVMKLFTLSLALRLTVEQDTRQVAKCAARCVLLNRRVSVGLVQQGWIVGDLQLALFAKQHIVGAP
jgi:hypothetical protein